MPGSSSSSDYEGSSYALSSDDDDDDASDTTSDCLSSPLFPTTPPEQSTQSTVQIQYTLTTTVLQAPEGEAEFEDNTAGGTFPFHLFVRSLLTTCFIEQCILYSSSATPYETPAHKRLPSLSIPSPKMYYTAGVPLTTFGSTRAVIYSTCLTLDYTIHCCPKIDPTDSTDICRPVCSRHSSCLLLYPWHEHGSLPFRSFTDTLTLR